MPYTPSTDDPCTIYYPSGDTEELIASLNSEVSGVILKTYGKRCSSNIDNRYSGGGSATQTIPVYTCPYLGAPDEAIDSGYAFVGLAGTIVDEPSLADLNLMGIADVLDSWDVVVSTDNGPEYREIPNIDGGIVVLDKDHAFDYGTIQKYIVYWRQQK